MDHPESIRALLRREGTNISWAHLTFNPWIGCQAVSPACDHCYAADLARNRLGVTFGPGEERRRTAASTWAKLKRWQRVAADAGVSLRVFCASLADWADNAVPDQWRADLAAQIVASPNLVFMLLTKRIGNARKMLEAMFPAGVPANVWLGITVCNQEEANRDVPRAISIRTGLRIRRLFLSIEPMRGPVDLSRWLTVEAEPVGIDMVIVGGESGKGARAMHPDWPWIVQVDCADAGVAFHFKQWGEWAPDPAGDRCVALETGRNMPNVEPHGRNGLLTARVRRIGVAKAGRTLRGAEYLEVPSC